MDSSPEISNWKWGYIILISKFVVNLMGSGVGKSFSVLLPDMVTRFRGTYALLGFTSSIPFTAMLFSGPLVSLILQYLQRGSHRLMAMVGGVLSGVCLGLSGFTSNIIALGVTLSITGVGRAFVYVPTAQLLFEYFAENYVLINTLTSFGETAGVMFLPVITERSLEAYGYSGVFIILGGIMFHLVVCGAAIRKPIFKAKDHNIPPMSQVDIDKGVSKRQDRETGFDVDDGCQERIPLINGSDHLSEVCDNAPSSVCDNAPQSDQVCDDAPSSDRVCDNALLLDQVCDNAPELDQVCDNDPQSHQDDSDKSSRCSSFLSRCKLFMMKEYLFMICLPTGFLFAYTFDAWVLFLVSHAEQLGIPQSRAVFISSIGGIGGIVGRIITIILLVKKVNMYPVYIVFGLIVSLTFFLDFVGKTFVIRSSLAFIQGFCFFVLETSGSTFFKSTLIDEANFSIALGLILVMHGMGSVSAGIFTGALFDVLGSYTIAFMITGLVPAFFTINIVVISVILKRRKKSS